MGQDKVPRFIKLYNRMNYRQVMAGGGGIEELIFVIALTILFVLKIYWNPGKSF